jgi:hypothetical protein
MLIMAAAALAACLAALLWWQVKPAQSATTVPNGFTDSLGSKSAAPASVHEIH